MSIFDDYLTKAEKPHPAHNDTGRLDVERYLIDHGVPVVSIKAHNGGTLYCLEKCVFDSNHSPNEAAIFQAADGKLSYQDFHDSCKDHTWHDARQLISGDVSLAPWMVGGNGHRRPYQEPESTGGLLPETKSTGIKIVDVGNEWIDKEPPPTNPVFDGFVDIGQRAAVIGGTKRRKSWIVATLAILSAAGRQGIGLKPAKPRKTLLVQFEIGEGYMWRRIQKLCRSMQITKDEIETRLFVVNLRDQLDDENFEKVALDIIDEAMRQTGAEVLIIDPIYVLNTGEENETLSMRRLLRRFGTINRTMNAALIYAMHDKKSGHYDLELSNRGSGTGLTARDYDGAMFLSPHESGDDDLTVVEFLVRHAPPRDSYCLRWEWDEEIHHFVITDDPPNKATKATRSQRELSTYIDKARGIISEYKIQIGKTLPDNAPPPMMPKKLFLERMSAYVKQKQLRSFCVEYIFDEDEQTGRPDSPIRAYTDKAKKNKKFVDNSIIWKNTSF